ncbi:MAG: peptide MFS transporter [Sphingosinicella sp.]|nr:peptide MFS transporter [Sphingosinicella sp.]
MISQRGDKVAAAVVDRTDDKSFFGHPKGLAYLAFTETWERFSYYGMTALVVLYMVQQLLLPGHIENVAGMAAYRSALESVFGPMSVQALASQTFGLYSGLVFFTPVFGGIIADRFLGAKRTVVIGALLMSAGHFAMAFDSSFLFALLLLILGCGCLKGSISAQVGQLYPRHEESRRTRAYAIFSMAINFGGVGGPLLCGYLAQVYGWHAGFGAAGVMMILATIVYLSGMRHLPDQQPRRSDRPALPPLTSAERKIVLLLILVMVITVFQTIAYFQIYNAGMIWISEHADLATPLGSVPVPWFNSIDAFASIIVVPPLVILWAHQAKAGREPGDIAKIGIGAAIAAASAGILALASVAAGAGRAPALFPILAYAGMGLAFIFYWPTFLALVSRVAPAKVNSTLMGAAYLSFFIGNIIMGWIGTLYEKMNPTAFWSLNAAIAATGALIVLAVGKPISRALTRSPGSDVLEYS